MDATEEVSNMMGYATMRWYDYRLTWDPQDYANIQMIYLKPSQVWKPDIMFGNEMNPDNRDAF